MPSQKPFHHSVNFEEAIPMDHLTRRGFLQASLATLGVYTLRSLRETVHADGVAGQAFLIGVNYPWIGYGHDFGKNAWGHDGIITGGWTYQTYPDSQGFTDTRYSTEKAHSGVSSLRITADLVGQHPNKSQGEVYVNLSIHAPLWVSVPVNLSNVTYHCWLCLPADSAGPSNARNGVQLFFKSKDPNSDTWYSFYSPWQNIEPACEGKWCEFTANPSSLAGYKDPQFDPTKIVAIGVKVAINSLSTATLKGNIYLDDVRLDTDPPIIFDFEHLEVDNDFRSLHDLAKCATRVIRVFVFADGRAAPEFTSNGAVSGFDENFFQDFDALLDTARQQNLLLIPVLLDFWWFNTAEFVNGAQLGGHSDIIRDSTKRQ